MIHGGKKNCEILFILEPMDKKLKEFIHSDSGMILRECLKKIKVNYKNCGYIISSDSIPRSIKGSQSKQADYVMQYEKAFSKAIKKYKPKMIVYFTSLAGKQLFKNPKYKTGKYLGVIRQSQMYDVPVLGCPSLLNAGEIMKGESSVRSYLLSLESLKSNEYKFEEDMYDPDTADYEWRVDISDVLKNKPKVIAFDTETTGLDWTKESVYPLVFQMTFEDGSAICSPVSDDYFPDYFKEKFGDFDMNVLIQQWKELIEDPEVGKVGHNIKYDMHIVNKLDIELKGLKFDTMQMLCNIDENMDKKDLANAVKVYVPKMAGYSDKFDLSVDKSKMIEVHPDDMILYAGGDTDATYRLYKALLKECKKDKRNFRVLKKVKMRGIEVFYHIEKNGVPVEPDIYQKSEDTLTKLLHEHETECLKLIPKKLLRKYMWGIPRGKLSKMFADGEIKGKGKPTDKDEDPLRLSDKALMIEAFFGKDGYDLDPVMFTKSTKGSDDKSSRIPEVTMNHFTYFDDKKYPVIHHYKQHSKIKTAISNFIGRKENEGKVTAKGEPKKNGHRPYFRYHEDKEEYRIHGDFKLTTTTGRCLVAGTKVKLKRGSKNIEDIKIGDEVLTHTGTYKKVINFFDNGKKEIMGIQLMDNTELWGTFNHKLMNEDGKWKKMEWFDIGKKVKCFSRGKFVSRRIKGMLYNRHKKHTYDIEVQEDHSFIANGIVSHNSRSTNPNLQNIPVHGEYAPYIKRGIRASKGKVLIGNDYSQAEIRMVASMANEKNMIEVYKNNLDIHINTAAEVVMGITVEDFLKQDEDARDKARQKSKGVNFGLLYDQQAKGFKKYLKTGFNVDVTLEEAEEMIFRYMNIAYPDLPAWHDRQRRFAKKYGYVRSMHGSKRHVPGIHSEVPYIVAENERYAINSPIQEIASDIGLLAMYYMNKDIPDKENKIINFVHDAIYMEVLIEKCAEYASALLWYMQNVPLKKLFGLELPVALVADCSIGKDLAGLMNACGTKSKHLKELMKYVNLKDKKYFDEVKDSEGNPQYILKAVKPDWCTLV